MPADRHSPRRKRLARVLLSACHRRGDFGGLLFRPDAARIIGLGLPLEALASVRKK
jgi:hypothetical protein